MKKITSLLLAVLILVSMCVPAYAQNTESPFSDLSSNHWAFPAVMKAYSDGILNGTYYNPDTGERQFSPGGKVTIAQFVTVVTRACYSLEIRPAEPEEPWFNPYMEVAADHGLLEGCGGVTVGDDANRYRMAIVMYNTMRDKNASMPNQNDLVQLQYKIGDWNSIPEAYRIPVATVFHLNIIRGMDELGTFNGDITMSREQLATVYCRLMKAMDPNFDFEENPSEKPSYQEAPTANTEFKLGDVPAYFGASYISVNNNQPYFKANELTNVSFEKYAPLDGFGRCVGACASIGKDLMPTEDRKPIGMIKPSGWHTIKYDFIDGKYLYNRCPLIGFQLSGENANVCNLITGTRYLNIDGMLPLENMTADYVKETGNHVMYRVTPVYDGNNLLASGVLMEGYSVEDKGAGINFCIFAYNAQPGVFIDYASGNSYADGTITDPEEPEIKPEPEPQPQPDNPSIGSGDYIINKNSGIFHRPDCPSVKRMNESNKIYFTGTREELISRGNTPCKNCRP